MTKSAQRQILATIKKLDDKINSKNRIIAREQRELEALHKEREEARDAFMLARIKSSGVSFENLERLLENMETEPEKSESKDVSQPLETKAGKSLY